MSDTKPKKKKKVTCTQCAGNRKVFLQVDGKLETFDCDFCSRKGYWYDED